MKPALIALLAFLVCLPAVVADKKPLITDPIVEKEEIRKQIKKPTGELTKADLMKVDELWLGAERTGHQLTKVPKDLEKLMQLESLLLDDNQLTELPKGLEKLTQLTSWLDLSNNQLTDVKGLEELTQLRVLKLYDNPHLTKAQIAELQEALPKCKIGHTAKK